MHFLFVFQDELEVVEEETEQYVRDLRAKLDKLTNKLRQKRRELEGLLTEGQSLRIQISTQKTECDALGHKRKELETEISKYDYIILKKKHKKKSHELILDRTKQKRSLLVVTHRGLSRELQAATRKCATTVRQMATLRKQIQYAAGEKEILYKKVEKKRRARAEKMQKLNLKLARIDNVQKARERREKKRVAILQRQQQRGMDALEKEVTKGMYQRTADAFKNDQTKLDQAFERIRNVTGEEDINKIVELFGVRHMLCDQVSQKIAKLRETLSNIQGANEKQAVENKELETLSNDIHRERSANAYKEIDELDTRLRQCSNQREHLGKQTRSLVLLKDALNLFINKSCKRFDITLEPTPHNGAERIDELESRIRHLKQIADSTPETQTSHGRERTHRVTNNIRVRIRESPSAHAAAERGKRLLRDIHDNIYDKSLTIDRHEAKKQAHALVQKHNREKRRRSKANKNKNKNKSKSKSKTHKLDKLDTSATHTRLQQIGSAQSRPYSRGRPIQPEVQWVVDADWGCNMCIRILSMCMWPYSLSLEGGGSDKVVKYYYCETRHCNVIILWDFY